MLSISFGQIKYVLALHKTGSFSDAAELCFVTQSTLSTMIKKMEQQFNFKIFNRQSKPITLTNEGEALIGQFQVIHHELEVLDELVRETKEDINGSLSIGIIPTLAPFLLPLFLDTLVSDYKNIDFIIHEITTKEITQRINSRELDVGILSIPIMEKGLVQTTLFQEDFLVYDASKKNNGNRRYKIKDIDISRLWLLEESHCLSNQIGHICHLTKKRAISNNLTYNCGSILSLLELVNMNEGLTLLPRLATVNKNLVQNNYLYNLEKPSPAREIGIVTHPNFAKKRILSVLEKEIIKAVKPILKKSKEMVLISPF